MSKHVKSIAQEIIGQMNNNSWQTTLLMNWNTIMGKLNSRVKLEKINNDTIVLAVYDSAWMQELYLLSEDIIKNINNQLGQEKIKQIKFKKADYAKSQIKVKHISKSCPIRKIDLSANESQALDKIKDKQLSTALKNFLIRCKNEK